MIQSSGVDFTSANSAEINTGGGDFRLQHLGNITLGELVQTGGGAFRVEGLQFKSLDAGAAIRTAGGSATFDLRHGVDLKGALNTAGGALHIVLHIAASTLAPVFRSSEQLDFAIGSTVTVDMDGAPISQLGTVPYRLLRAIQAPRFGRLPTDVRLIDTAFGDTDFVAELVASGTTALDLLIRRIP
jgi:hypothetical protein